jgi:phosphomannomutase
VSLYFDIDMPAEFKKALGVSNIAEARVRGCVVGHDNRFGGEILAQAVTDVLTSNGFVVHYAGESTTGVLSAAVLELNAAFSINLTPSHNPFQYGGFKFNAADAGPASPVITSQITERTRAIMANELPVLLNPDPNLVRKINGLDHWLTLVRKGYEKHGLDYDRIMARLSRTKDVAVVIDSVYGASRIHLQSLLKGIAPEHLFLLRTDNDPTFSGIAPEPSSANMAGVKNTLQKCPERYKIGAIIDPDADRIRFTDGIREISMNQFGAMAYHFIHELKHKKGLVAKSVATSNFANVLATSFGEDIFEPKVGFKEFKPVVNTALVCFEESDGLTIIGHTPEKDAYIGLLLALDMVLTVKKNLGEYLAELETTYGSYYPGRDSIVVTQKGKELLNTLSTLTKYRLGSTVMVGKTKKNITKIIDIDGHKMIFEDGSWLMIRPSGTEPKVRFYYEGRSEEDCVQLLNTAKNILHELGLS